MKTRRYLIVVVGLVAGLAIMNMVGRPTDDLSQPAKNEPLTKHLDVIAGIPYWEYTQAFQSFQGNVGSIDTIALFWYYLTEDGSIKKYSDAQDPTPIIEFARQHQVQVLALIANLPEEEDTTWDWQRVQRVTNTAAARQHHIAEIVELVERHGYDGINIDYETLRDHQTTAFTAFVQELSTALRDRGKTLKVAIQPRTTNRYQNGQDWVALARAVDQFSLMTYEEHWDASRPGPVASLPWVRRVLDFAVALGVPQEKIFLGVPFYGYDWPQRPGGSYGTAEGLEYVDVLALDQAHQVDPTFAWPAASPHFTYSSNGRLHEVWYENKLSFAHKFNLAKEFRVGGLSLWRLGGEDQGIWSILTRLNPK
ncbi:MAG: hypothetical protein HYY50_00465 [Candidatus Kerfeldbacteria bacterium]|nr:hypothetical protein [Candidatus Kerfeldbacteria bacterium]